MGHLQTGKSVVTIDATRTGTVICTTWETISSAQKTINMENTFSFKDTGTFRALFVNETGGNVA